MPPAVAMVLAVVVVAEIAWAAFVLAGSDDLRPHAVPAVVAADPVVAESVARQYDDLPGDPFDLRAVTNEDTARAALDDGSARAALIVDLEGSVDRLLLASANDDTLDAAIRDRVEQTDESLGRTVDVETVGPADADERREAARLAVALALLLGFLLAVGTSLRDGPVSRTHLRALRRTLVIGSASVVGGALIGVLVLRGSWVEVLVAAAVAGAAAVSTIALEALFGWAGLGLVVVAFFATGAPVLARVDPYLVGEPWASLAGLGVPGSGVDTATAVTLRGELAVGPVAVLLVWIATSLLVVVLAGSVRRRYAVPEPVGDESLRDLSGVNAWRVRVLGVVAPLTAAMLALAVVVPRAGAATPAPWPRSPRPRTASPPGP